MISCCTKDDDLTLNDIQEIQCKFGNCAESKALRTLKSVFMRLEYYDSIVCANFPPCLDENMQPIPEYFILPSEEYLDPGFWDDPTSAVPAQGIHHEPV